MNLEYKFTKEDIANINNKKLIKPEKDSGWRKFWLKFGEFFAKGATTRKWEFKITYKF